MAINQSMGSPEIQGGEFFPWRTGVVRRASCVVRGPWFDWGQGKLENLTSILLCNVTNPGHRQRDGAVESAIRLLDRASVESNSRNSLPFGPTLTDLIY